MYKKSPPGTPPFFYIYFSSVRLSLSPALHPFSHSFSKNY